MTKWTTERRQELSRKVAEKFGIEPFRQIIVGLMPADFECTETTTDLEDIWLHDDWHTIMELCVKHDVRARHPFQPSHSIAYYGDGINGGMVYSDYLDHNNDPSLAERVARMMALMEVN